MDGQPEIGGSKPERLVHGERERRAAELGRIEAEQEVVHDRVADDRHLEDGVALHSCGLRELGGQLREAAADDARQLLSGAGVEHDVGDAAHQVLAEADLRVHLTGGREHVSAPEVAQVTRHRRRADVEGDAVRVLVEPGPDCRDRASVVNRDRDAPAARAKRRLEIVEHVRVELELFERPFACESLAQPSGIRRGTLEPRLLDLDVVEPHDRVHLDRVRVGLLAHDLAIELALGRDVDDEVARDVRDAAQAARRGKPALGRVRALDLVHVREVRRRRRDAVLRVLALVDLDLAASADSSASADGVEIDAEPAGGVENREPVLEPSPATGRREDNQCLAPSPASAPAGRSPAPPTPAPLGHAAFRARITHTVPSGRDPSGARGTRELARGGLTPMPFRRPRAPRRPR